MIIGYDTSYGFVIPIVKFLFNHFQRERFVLSLIKQKGPFCQTAIMSKNLYLFSLIFEPQAYQVELTYERLPFPIRKTGLQAPG
jgi:hypothetical protein